MRVELMLFSLRGSLIVMTHKMCSGKTVSAMKIHVAISLEAISCSLSPGEKEIYLNCAFFGHTKFISITL